MIDISRLAPPTLIGLDYEALIASRLASLKRRFEAADIPWDVEVLETDPAVILQEEDAYRQVNDHAAINDMAKARTLGFAKGADLDWIAATFYADLGLVRLDGELDDRFERRILLAAEGLAGALTAGGIVYHALTHDLRIVDAAAYQVGVGANHCVLLVSDGAPASDILSSTFARLRAPKLRGTEELSISLATPVPHAVAVRLQHGSGPDPSLLRSSSAAKLAAVKARVERSIGEKLPLDEIIAEARVGGVTKLIVDSPIADLDPGPAGVLRITDITVTSEVVA